MKKNGELFFPNGIKEIKIISDDTKYSGILLRYESINSFISVKNDINKEKEYLISMSSWQTVLELYDLDEDEYKIMASSDFTKNEDGIFSFVFQILEAKINNQNIYFCIYIYSKITSGDYFVIKKIAFKSFDSNFLEPKIEIEEKNYNNRIISSIIVDKYEILIIFTVQEDSYGSSYYFYYYNYDLELKRKQYINNIISYDCGNGLYFKSYYLYDDYFAFFAFVDKNGGYIFKIMKIKEDTQNNFDFEVKLQYANNKYSLDYNIIFNDFVKFDKERLALISTQSQTKLFIILFDLYDSYSEMKVRYYYFDFTNDKIHQFTNELSAFIYNGYLTLTATVNYNFPILLIFGYANGTDSEINISPYLSDCEDYDNTKNLVNDLVENLTIDNNIFNYQKEEKIKLISIPQEILFFNSYNLKVSNGDILDTDYILKQNNDIIKEDKYYFLEYQNIIREPDYDSFYGNAFDLENVVTSTNLSYYFEPRILYGRANTLRFKLCNLYCKQNMLKIWS